LGRYLPDGNIEFLGREDFQVKVAGHRIELGEIEATLLDHPRVHEAVVTAIGKPFENKHLVAYVIPSGQARWRQSANQTDDAQDSVNWETLVTNSQTYGRALSEPNIEDAFLDAWQILQQMYLQAFCQALNDFEVFGSVHEHYSLDELMQKCAIRSRYKKWVNRNIHFLVENGYLQQENGLLKRAKALPTRALDELWVAYQKAATRLTDPTLLALGWHKRFPLMPSQTMENLKSILTEELHSAEIYLSAETSEAYGIFHYSNTMLQILTKEFVRLTSERKKIRVLEIGAGFGTATAYILPTLPRTLTEYIYTDISPYFLQEAQEKFAEYPFVEYRLLDIEKNPQSQGYEMQDFDIIIAASVLHATANIVETLTHVRSLLKPHGILLLLEETHFHQIFDLTMGLQQGFDRFEDTELRQSHPLLSRDMWHEVLRKQGFASSAIFNKPGTLTDFLGFDVVLAQGPAEASPLRLAELYEHLRSKLPEYMIPARIVPLSTLPLTSNGKVDRHALPHPLIQSQEHAKSLRAARTPTEQALVHLWSVILERSHVGIEENFLELGGDSLLATKLLARIRADFNIEVPLQVMFKNPTIAVLAKTIEQAQAKHKMQQRSSAEVVGTGLAPVLPTPPTPALSLDEEEGVL
jgi:SAM-dependent methyltransferase/acyl carrier protein